ncbi:killer cell immunoglobulin-like receptor 3DL1 [Peromyscus maniculatus bairdii]|uniref:killer cell immunoglobulin-like receptor 3DL1 n=1 Tax=Peromyscus maniculatus bairdii TaxID=230844 RepID=UPI003FCF1732
MFLLLRFPSCGQADASSLLRHPICFILVLPLVSQSSTMLSVLLNLICTGYHDKPSLSAWPSHIVPLGQHVELQCDSPSDYYTFKLYKELGNPIPLIQERPSQKKFLFGPVTTEHAGTYRCYGLNYHYAIKISANSDPVKIIISGVYRKPFLLALQPPLVNLGEKVTLECYSEIMFETFILTSHKNGTIKDSFELSAEHHLGGSQANFSIGPVTPDDAETYTCYGSFNHSPYEWSESSDPIDIKITGLYKKPSLSALMGPVVMSGENMTLTCFSDLQFDMFHLSREGVPKRHGLPSVQNHSGTFQASFHLGPVVQAGKYRCYGSFRNSSHLWSTPSDPLYLPVTEQTLGYSRSPGTPIQLCPSCQQAGKTTAGSAPLSPPPSDPAIYNLLALPRYPSDCGPSDTLRLRNKLPALIGPGALIGPTVTSRDRESTRTKCDCLET